MLPALHLHAKALHRNEWLRQKMETRSTKTQEQLLMSQMQKTQVIVSHTSASKNP
jgi:hypothetical protein